MRLQSSLLFPFLLFLCSCRSSGVVEDNSPFAAPLLFNDVEFLIEKSRRQGEAEVSFDFVRGVLYEGGRPIMRQLRYSIFEIEGRRYHFPKGTKVFLFRPRPEGELGLRFRDLQVVLKGNPRKHFVLQYRTEGVEEIQYGLARIAYDGGTYVVNGKHKLTPEEIQAGLRLTRTGVFSSLKGAVPTRVGRLPLRRSGRSP